MRKLTVDDIVDADRAEQPPGVVEHRHGEQPGADDAGREEEKSEFARQRAQRLGRLRRGLDVGLARRMQGHGRRQDDEEGDKVGDTHADPGFPADARELARRLLHSFLRQILSDGLYHADPHPGNYRFLGGGRVAFLDYGCVKVVPPDLLAGTKRYVTAAMDEDWPAFERAFELTRSG